MADIQSLLQKSDLFSGLNENQIKEALSELETMVRDYGKGEILLHAENKVASVGIILSGIIEISRQDYLGNRFIMNQLHYPDMFGEALAYGHDNTSQVTLTAIKTSRVLWIDSMSIFQKLKNTNTYQRKLTENMVHLLATKVQFLSSRLDLLCKKTIKSKLSAYLLSVTEQASGCETDIPYNREELADYLCTNRSALSNELCKMRDAGVIDFRKNHFIIYDMHQLSIWANKNWIMDAEQKH